MYAPAVIMNSNSTTPVMVFSTGHVPHFEARDRVDPIIAASAKSGASALRVEPIRIRHYSRDHSVFADGQYLIRGVAGAVLWKLVREYQERGRTEFCSRELRAAGKELGLPEIVDNLSARLLLLANRLEQIAAPIRLERLGGGRIRLAVDRGLALEAA